MSKTSKRTMRKKKPAFRAMRPLRVRSRRVPKTGSTSLVIEEEDDRQSSRRCPYCSSTDDCPHLMLFLDVDNYEALGGILYAAFEKEWSSFSSDYRDDPEFIPGDPFTDLLNDVDRIAGARREYEEETPVGCSGYQAFYIESPRPATTVIKKFRLACVAWRKRWHQENRSSLVPTTSRAPRTSKPSGRNRSATKRST
jgi:hypothetical protein